MDHSQLLSAFEEADREIAALEQAVADRRLPPLKDLVEQVIVLIKKLLIAYIQDEGRKTPPEGSADLLEVFKVLVKGEPFWNTIRDNCRELVYYRNCLAMNREDALPPAPEKMTVRLARHLYLFIKTRCIREGRMER